MVKIYFLIPLGVYSLNGRRLIVKHANDVLCVRIGGGYMPLTQYLTIYSFEDHQGDNYKNNQGNFKNVKPSKIYFKGNESYNESNRSLNGGENNNKLYTINRRKMNKISKSRSKTPTNFRF